MLRTLNDLIGLKAVSLNGDVGSVKEFFFDDEHWTLRYVVINTGGFLSRHEVLVSPMSILEIDSNAKFIRFNLTKEKIESSPDVASDLPISRSQEVEYLSYYSLPYYWLGPMTWGGYPLVDSFNTPSAEEREQRKLAREYSQNQDTHLQSTHDVFGYKVCAEDDNFGRVKDFIVDTLNWAIRYLVVDTSAWKKRASVVISPLWVQSIRWDTKVFVVSLKKSEILSAPHFDVKHVDVEYERKLHEHYKRSPYWEPAPHTVPGSNSSNPSLDSAS